jgi:hypothetical protein
MIEGLPDDKDAYAVCDGDPVEMAALVDCIDPQELEA